MQGNTTLTEADVLADLIAPDEPGLSPDEARAILRWKFSDTAVKQMSKLAARNQKGTISETEADQLQRYLRVGQMVNQVQAKARLWLRDAR